MYKYAIIVAGGSGIRMGGDIPKQFLLLKDKPVLWHSIKAFANAYNDIEIILVLPAAHVQRGEELLKEFPSCSIQITIGGDTRFQSVKNGLKLVKEESVVFVHDAVRCLVTADLIHRCYEQAIEKNSAIPVIKSKDSLRMKHGQQTEPLDRNKVMLVQTPQTFQSKILLNAYEVEYNEKFTDEATVVENSGQKVSIIEGEEDNIKITNPIDLLMAEQIVDVRNRKADI